jgi:hypothetical protein
MKKIIILLSIIITSQLSINAYSGNREYINARNNLALQWHLKAEASQKYEKTLGLQVTKLWKGSKECYRTITGSLSLVVEINAAGDVSGAWTNREGIVDSCAIGKALKVKFTEPPFNPFYMRIEMN